MRVTNEPEMIFTSTALGPLDYPQDVHYIRSLKNAHLVTFFNVCRPDSDPLL